MLFRSLGRGFDPDDHFWVFGRSFLNRVSRIRARDFKGGGVSLEAMLHHLEVSFIIDIMFLVGFFFITLCMGK